VVSRGVTPALPIGMVGETAPYQRMAAAPPPDLPVLKSVIVVAEPVLAGKARFAARFVDPPEAADHPVLRATFCRA
jgi:hypothetical protein